jgi:hypothetical protein
LRHNDGVSRSGNLDGDEMAAIFEHLVVVTAVEPSRGSAVSGMQRGAAF